MESDTMEKNDIVIEDFPSFLIRMDFEGRIISFNKNVFTHYGFTGGIGSGKRFTDLFCHTETEHRYLHEVIKLLQADKESIAPFVSTIILRHSAVKVLWNAKYSNSIESEMPHIVLSGNVFQDCINDYFNTVPILQNCCNPLMYHSSEGKLTEYYRVSKDFLHILNEQTELIVLCAPDGKINFANNTYRKYFNLPDEINNIYWMPPFTKDDNQAEIRILGKITPDNSMVIFEQKYNEESSNPIWIHWIIKAYFSDIGELIEYQATGRDFTEKKVAELEREKLIIEFEKNNAQLKELAQMKDDFLSIASHDLRSPSMCITGYADLLSKSATLSGEDKLYVNMIKIAAENQLQFINDLLDIIKLESGKTKLKVSNYSINDIIYSCFDSHLVLAKKKGIEFKFRIDTNKMVWVDKAKIMQILNNLITNAIKFTPSGGRILLWCYENDKNELEIHIKDNGVGITKDDINLLFSPFFQYHTEGTEGEPGTGLGLAICKNFIELHNGKLNVISIPGNGSDFYFTLPLNSGDRLTD